MLIAFAALIACQPDDSPITLGTATPTFVPSAGNGSPAEIGGGGADSADAIGDESPIEVPPPIPDFVPTPDPTRAAVTAPNTEQVHVVQSGDTLGTIAAQYGVTVDMIVAANGLYNASLISEGDELIIPSLIETVGPSNKLIPDSELVYGPAAKGFDVGEWVSSNRPDSFLAGYQEEIDDIMWSGVDLVERVAVEQSINPRLLLAMLEYQSQWLSHSTLPNAMIRYPMDYTEKPDQIVGLYKQLDWAGKALAAGYYGWREQGLSTLVLEDGLRVAMDPAINAGTAAVQVWLARTRNHYRWSAAVGPDGFITVYRSLFGDPFRYAVEPLIPTGLTQPSMSMPWDTANEKWYFTSGPHGGWGSSSWAALDFAPDDANGCNVSPTWARAVADGVIARSDYGIVILDLDGDGYEGTGWTVFYLHLSSEDRPVVEGQTVSQGDPLGHPSCEGGVSYSTHLHIARRYNGVWIPADCSQCPLTIPAPQLNFDGWTAVSFGGEYYGALVNGDRTREAHAGGEYLNAFTPADFN
ncbi:MAG: LysM peptidoglycan-binding domain-containing protein [Anaerolineae bacterium]|nr:LysM peptidoglycan-binding domain-containing protein [Anaerolineae bacterium]